MIKSDINIRFGAPRIDGSRLIVSDILGYISGGDTFETLIQNFPELNKEKIQIALDYAVSTVNNTPIIFTTFSLINYTRNNIDFINEFMKSDRKVLIL